MTQQREPCDRAGVFRRGSETRRHVRRDSATAAALEVAVRVPAHGVRRPRVVATCSLLAFALCGCASQPMPLASTTAQRPQLARAAVLAPDFAARALRAYRDASTASSEPVRKDHLRRAQLLEQAAIAEADRIAFERELAALEQQLAAAVTSRGASERARVAAEAELQRVNAATEERALARRVFATLAGRAPTASQEADPIAAFLLRRAQSLLAAATALTDRAGPEQTTARKQLELARATHAGDRIRLAQRALLSAEIALGAARKQAGDVNDPQRNDLAAALRERGFEPELAAQGLQIPIGALFAPGATQARPEMQRRLQLLLELLPAYPHGAIRIACITQELERTRAARVLSLFEVVSGRERLAREPLESGELRLVLPAYARPDR